ncbi:MAG: hypothetical protein QM796_18990 [Chthoniobacteraceae bacterium]
MNNLPVNRFRIILLCAGAAIIYGVLHDQVTARLCLEYFTVAHPPLFPVTSPTLVALCWGTAATAGLGTVFGVLLAQLAHAGSQPPLSATRLMCPLAKLLGAMALSALAAGGGGYWLARWGVISMPAVLAAVIPPAKHDFFMAVWFAHGASYLVGLGGAGFVLFRTWCERGRPPSFSLYPRSSWAVLRTLVLLIVTGYILWSRFGRH